MNKIERQMIISYHVGNMCKEKYGTKLPDISTEELDEMIKKAEEIVDKTFKEG